MATLGNTDEDDINQSQGQTNATNTQSPTSAPTTGTSNAPTGPVSTATGGSGNAPTVAPTSGAGGSSGGSTGGGASSGGGNATNPAPTSSGSYNNLQQYFNANQNFNQAGGGLAGQLAGNIQGQANQATSGINNASNAFNTQAASAAAPWSNQTNDASLINQATTNPYGFTTDTSNPGNTQAFQNLLGANYSGPTSLLNIQGADNYGTLQTQDANVGNEIQQAQSDTGRQNLLNQTYGGNGYTAGDSTLDNLFLQNSPGQLSQLQGLQSTGNNLNTLLNNALQSSQATGANYQQQAQAVSQQAQNGINSAIYNYIGNAGTGTAGTTGYQAPTGLYATAATDQATANANYAALQQGLASGNISQETANALGLTNGQYLYGGNLSQYLGQNTGQATAQNTASAQNLANLQAYNTLGGSYINTPNSAALSPFLGSTQPTAFSTDANQYLNNAVTPGGANGYLSQLAAGVQAGTPYQTAQANLNQANQEQTIMGKINSDMSALEQAGMPAEQAYQQAQNLANSNPDADSNTGRTQDAAAQQAALAGLNTEGQGQQQTINDIIANLTNLAQTNGGQNQWASQALGYQGYGSGANTVNNGVTTAVGGTVGAAGGIPGMLAGATIGNLLGNTNSATTAGFYGGPGYDYSLTPGSPAAGNTLNYGTALNGLLSAGQNDIYQGQSAINSEQAADQSALNALLGQQVHVTG